MTEPDHVTEPPDAGCVDDGERPYDLIDPGDEPAHEEVVVPS